MFGHLLTLAAGALIYILFRTSGLLMFRWFTAILPDTPIHSFREVSLPFKESLPNWFLYSLPDALWIFSYLSLILMIWDNTINKHNFFWIYSIPLIAILSESGQAFHVVPGTYDLTDLIFYIAGTLSALIIFSTNLFPFYSKTT